MTRLMSIKNKLAVHVKIKHNVFLFVHHFGSQFYLEWTLSFHIIFFFFFFCFLVVCLCFCMYILVHWLIYIYIIQGNWTHFSVCFFVIVIFQRNCSREKNKCQQKHKSYICISRFEFCFWKIKCVRRRLMFLFLLFLRLFFISCLFCVLCVRVCVWSCLLLSTSFCDDDENKNKK